MTSKEFNNKIKKVRANVSAKYISKDTGIKYDTVMRYLSGKGGKNSDTMTAIMESIKKQISSLNLVLQN